MKFHCLLIGTALCLRVGHAARLKVSETIVAAHSNHTLVDRREGAAILNASSILHLEQQVEKKIEAVMNASSILHLEHKISTLIGTAELSTTLRRSLQILMIILFIVAGFSFGWSCGRTTDDDSESDFDYDITASNFVLTESTVEACQKLVEALSCAVKKKPSTKKGTAAVQVFHNAVGANHKQDRFVSVILQTMTANVGSSTLAWWKDEKAYRKKQLPQNQISLNNIESIYMEPEHSQPAVAISHKVGSKCEKLVLYFDNEWEAKDYSSNLKELLQMLQPYTVRQAVADGSYSEPKRV